MSDQKGITVADVEGPWVPQGFESGLIERCRRGWNTPIGQLSNEQLATYLRQKIALSLLVSEARSRIAARVVFYKDRDYAAFERILESTLEAVPLRLLSYCLMPKHWHLSQIT